MVVLLISSVVALYAVLSWVAFRVPFISTAAGPVLAYRRDYWWLGAIFATLATAVVAAIAIALDAV